MEELEPEVITVACSGPTIFSYNFQQLARNSEKEVFIYSFSIFYFLLKKNNLWDNSIKLREEIEKYIIRNYSNSSKLDSINNEINLKMDLFQREIINFYSDPDSEPLFAYIFFYEGGFHQVKYDNVKIPNEFKSAYREFYNENIDRYSKLLYIEAKFNNFLDKKDLNIKQLQEKVNEVAIDFINSLTKDLNKKEVNEFQLVELMCFSFHFITKYLDRTELNQITSTLTYSLYDLMTIELLENIIFKYSPLRKVLVSNYIHSRNEIYFLCLKEYLDNKPDKLYKYLYYFIEIQRTDLIEIEDDFIYSSNIDFEFKINKSLIYLINSLNNLFKEFR